MALAITPAGLGIYEAFAAASAAALGPGAACGLLAALAVRSAFLVVALILAPVFFILLPGRETPQTGEEEIPQ
jgi:hypothetical protein